MTRHNLGEPEPGRCGSEPIHIEIAIDGYSFPSFNRRKDSHDSFFHIGNKRIVHRPITRKNCVALPHLLFRDYRATAA